MESRNFIGSISQKSRDILQCDVYYELLIKGRIIVNEISILKPTYLIPFKVKAWLDLNEKTERGEHVDSRDIKKHRNDIIRILSELALEPCELSSEVKRDMNKFADRLHITDAELKNLKIFGIHESDIISILKRTYHLVEEECNY